MALFGSKEAKEDKISRKAQAMMEKYGLMDINQTDFESVKTISNALLGNHLIEMGTALQGNGIDTAKMSYLRALVEQNWIIIRQLDAINKKLDHQ